MEAGLLTDHELLERADALAREISCLQVEHAKVVAELDARRVWAAEGSRSCAAWLALRTRCSRGAAGAAVALGRGLRHMPKVDEALSSGAIGVDHARVLARCRRFAPVAFAGDEAFLVAAAVEQRTWANFGRVVAAWQDAVNPDGTETAALRARSRRRLVLHRRGDGSVAFQDGELDPLGAEAFLDELERLETELFEADWAAADGDQARLLRTATQRRADALVEMAHRSRTAPADGQRPEPLVVVYVDYETVTGRLCELASGAPVTPGQILPLLDACAIERVVFGPGNRVLEVGIRDRCFTGALRRAIQLRDRHCQWPGCTTPAARCDVDHVVAYAHGGTTTQRNGRLLCAKHNRLRTRMPADPFDWHAADGDTRSDLQALIGFHRRRLDELEHRHQTLTATAAPRMTSPTARPPRPTCGPLVVSRP